MAALILNTDKGVDASGILDIGSIQKALHPWHECRVTVDVNVPDPDRTYWLVIESDSDEEFEEKVALSPGRKSVFLDVWLGRGPLLFGLVRTSGPAGASPFTQVTVTVVTEGEASATSGLGEGWDDDPLDLGRARL